MLSELVHSISAEPGIALVVIIMALSALTGIVISGTAILAGTWRRIRQSEDINGLKQQMLEMGMPADEIATVISAWPKKKRTSAPPEFPQA